MKKRILSILLTLCMVLCIVPISAFAEGETFTNVDGAILDTAYNAKAQRLDNDYGYTEYDLGATHIVTGNDEKMRFRLWSPTASKVRINVFTKGTDDEAGATMVGSYALEKLNENGKWTGVWEITLIGIWHAYYYTYSVTDADTGATKEIADPYSRQLSKDRKRSYIVNFDHNSFKPDGWDSDSHVYFDSVKACSVYRLDIESYTSAEVDNRGKFLGLTETGTHYLESDENPSTGLDHIKQLGVAAVELSGVCDAANAFALNLQCTTKQNSAVSELRQLINKLHSEGLTVIIKLPAGFVKLNNGAFDDAVPNYYFRLNEAGKKLDGSGFGNELASERMMYRNWLITTLLGWVNEYHIDGFSIEQSALIDTDTLSAAITAVKAADSRIAVFADGECKAVGNHPSNVCTGETFRRATRANSQYLPSTLIFEERSGKSLYTEICENLGVSNDLRNETAVKKVKFAAGLLALSKGVFYIDAGDEMCAAELYDSFFEWKNIGINFDVFSYYRGLLQLRATFPEFASGGLQFNRGNVLSASDSGNKLAVGSDPNSWKTVSISYNATDNQVKKSASGNLSDWDIVTSSGFAGIDSRDKLPKSEGNYFTVDAYSLNVAVDSASFAAAGFNSGMEALTIEFINEETSEKLAPDMVLTGKSGEGFILPNRGNPRLANGYELHKTNYSSASGIFGATTQIKYEYGYIFDGIKDGVEYCSPAEFKLKGIENVIKVQMDGVALTPDGETYALTGSGEHTVTVETKDGTHTIKVKLRGNHAYRFIAENGMYYKKCSACGHTTSPQAIPSVEITAPNRVCAGEDCVVTVGTLPNGVTVDGGFYEFGLMVSDIDVNEKNGVWSGTVSHGEYQPDADTFDIGVKFKTADGYLFTVKKTVNVLAQHTGGTATCTEKAKCEVCGDSYGDLDSNNHTGTAKWVKDAQGHEKKYTCCGSVIVASEPHEWTDGVCRECGYVCSHDDNDKNHICDICGKIISNHKDTDKNHICDFCGKIISNHKDTDKNHICDFCDKIISNHEDTDKNHICDYCDKTISNHEDKDKNHICDYCDKIISNHEDTDKNHICNYCGKVITNHTGGKATCKDKAVCDYCGKSYGELDPGNHANLKHIPAKAATKDAEGNIEYWYCEGCDRYYSDAEALNGIVKGSFLIMKLTDEPKSPKTGDNSDRLLWAALLFIGGGVCAALTVKKKKQSKK